MPSAKRSSKKKKQQRSRQVVSQEVPYWHYWKESLKAATTGQLSAVKEFLDLSCGFASIEVCVPIDGKPLSLPLLQAVVANSHSEVADSVALLAAAGAEVNATYKDHDGQQCSALMWAVAGASCRTVEALLRAGQTRVKHSMMKA
jgi:hypothetical protein